MVACSYGIAFVGALAVKMLWVPWLLDADSGEQINAFEKRALTAESQLDKTEAIEKGLCAGIRRTLRLTGVFEEEIFRYARQDERERMDKDSGMAGVQGLSHRDQ
jgi:hypothetical protein